MARRKNQRLQVSTDIQQPAFRPTTSPVDTFSNPDAGSQLAQLAQGLSTISPSLSRLSNVVAERSAEENTARGAAEARRLQEERITYKEAAKRGLIEPHQNPWFVFGLKQQMGRVAAGDYANSLNVAMQKAIADGELLGDTPDVEEFREFESNYRKQWMEENVGEKRDLHFEKGFAMVDGLVQNEANKYAAAVGAKYAKTAGEALSRETLQILDSLKAGAKPEEVVAQINAVMAGHLLDNPKGGRMANERIIEAVTTWAIAEENAEVLDYLKQIKGGTGNLYGTAEARQAVVNAETAIVRKRMSRYEAENAEERRADKVAEESLMTEVIGALQGAQDPSTVDLEPYVQRMLKIDPSAQATEVLYTLRKAYVDRAEEGDPQAYRDAILRVHGVNPERPGFLTLGQAARMAAAKEITTAQFSLIVNEIQERERRAREGGGRMAPGVTDPLFKEVSSQLMRRLSEMNPSGVMTSEIRNRMSSAENEFMMLYLASLRTEQPADPLARAKALTSMADLVFNTWASPEMKEGRTAVTPNAPAPLTAEQRGHRTRIAREVEAKALTMQSVTFLKSQGVDPKNTAAVRKWLADNP